MITKGEGQKVWRTLQLLPSGGMLPLQAGPEAHRITRVLLPLLVFKRPVFITECLPGL